MHLLQEAQWPLAMVFTPIFSRSELSPPSSSSILSVLVFVVEAFAPEMSLLFSFFSCCPPSVFLFTGRFCVGAGRFAEGCGS